MVHKGFSRIFRANGVVFFLDIESRGYPPFLLRFILFFTAMTVDLQPPLAVKAKSQRNEEVYN